MARTVAEINAKLVRLKALSDILADKVERSISMEGEVSVENVRLSEVEVQIEKYESKLARLQGRTKALGRFGT